MAWTTPNTWTAALVTVAQFNTYIRDNMLAILPSGTATTTYTPTWAGGSVSIGNGTLTGKYQQIGKKVFLNIYLVGGTTTNWGGATTWTFSVPVTAASDGVTYTGIVQTLDSGTGFHAGVCALGSGGTTLTITPTTASSANSYQSTVPMTWATGDSIYLSLVYTAA